MSYSSYAKKRGDFLKSPRFLAYFAKMCVFVYLIGMPLICGMFDAPKPHLYNDVDVKKPTKVEIYAYILEIGIKYPDVAFAQARIESGNFKSALYRKHANMFGMRHPRKRATESIRATKSGYAVYKDWRASIIDYALWQSRILYKCPTKRRYIEYLSRAYAESPHYAKIFNSIKNG